MRIGMRLPALLCGLVLVPSTARAQEPVASGFIPASDGVQLYYEIHGSGDPVTVVPGRLFFSGEDLHRLTSGGAVVTYDMRNRGRSDHVLDPTSLGILQDVSDLDEVRRGLGGDRVNLIGYSYLGLMVALYAREHPSHVHRVVQLGPVPLRSATRYRQEDGVYPPPELRDSTSLLAARAMREAGEHLTQPREYCELSWSVTRHALIGDPTHLDRLGGGPCHMPNEWPTVLQRHFGFHFPTVQALDLTWRDFADLRVPVLVIHGDRDRNAPIGAGREWAAGLRNARFLQVRGAAHRSWVDAPDLVFAAVNSFLAGEWPAAAIAQPAGP